MILKLHTNILETCCFDLKKVILDHGVWFLLGLILEGMLSVTLIKFKVAVQYFMGDKIPEAKFTR